MSFPVRLEWSTASVGSSHAPTDAVDHSAPSAIRPESTYISGKVVQTNGATSRSTYARHRIRYGLRHTAALAGRRDRPSVPNDRLRHRLIGYARVSKADGS